MAQVKAQGTDVDIVKPEEKKSGRELQTMAEVIRWINAEAASLAGDAAHKVARAYKLDELSATAGHVNWTLSTEIHSGSDSRTEPLYEAVRKAQKLFDIDWPEKVRSSRRDATASAV